jgi:UDP-N-acetylglucosamine 2-epimerase (non-hydrolysing)
MPVVFPIHPRTKKNIEATSLRDRVATVSGLRLIDPLGYLDFLKLMADAAIVLTDSGGIQEETTILEVPCLTLRDNTERPVTITHGTNRLTGNATQAIVKAYRDVRCGAYAESSIPDLWDGRAAERIVACLTGEDPPGARPVEAAVRCVEAPGPVRGG